MSIGNEDKQSSIADRSNYKSKMRLPKLQFFALFLLKNIKLRYPSQHFY